MPPSNLRTTKLSTKSSKSSPKSSSKSSSRSFSKSSTKSSKLSSKPSTKSSSKPSPKGTSVSTSSKTHPPRGGDKGERPKGPEKKCEERKPLVFNDFPDFQPNLTPAEIFRAGAFGGTYWRPIHSTIVKQNLHDCHREFPPEWWEGLDKDRYLTAREKDYDVEINKYKAKSGSSLEYWETHGWIHRQDPYGWVQWYCRFYGGRRTEDDERQMGRWKKIAGAGSGRWRKILLNKLVAKEAKFDDVRVSPVIRQLLLHWGYELTETDMDSYVRGMGRRGEGEKGDK